MYIERSLKEYLDDLAAKKPAPGGGSAAALTGALGAALLEMVCNFTIGNKKYEGIEEAIGKHLISLKEIRKAFSALIDEDVKVYSSICAAFKIKDDLAIDNALKEGYYISLKMCKLAERGIILALNLAKKSNSNLITDVGCGAELLKASFDSGVFNSEMNLKGIKGRSFTERERTDLDALKKDMLEAYKKTILKVNERMM